MRIWLSGLVPRLDDGPLRCAFFVKIRIVLIEHPFGHVAIHIVKPPGIWLFLADLLIFEVAVLLEPGVFRKLRGIVSKVISGSRARAAGVFPLGLGRQAIELARLGAKPLAIF